MQKNKTVRYDFTKPTALNRLLNVPLWMGWGIWIACVLVKEHVQKKG